MTKREMEEKEQAISKLREMLKPGDTVYTILDHVSSSGMMRAIRVVLLSCDKDKVVDLHPNYMVGKALGLKHWMRHGRTQDALKISGCGMDMGFHLVYELSYTLFPVGFDCIGKDCPSNDHMNGDRDYSPHKHGSGGYALRHRWL